MTTPQTDSTVQSETEQRERPILFSAPMVRAILDGRKTQTRRVVKLGREFGASNTPGYDWTFRGTRRGGLRGAGAGCWQDYRHDQLLALCPYGQVGDRLWVRETFARYTLGGGIADLDPAEELVTYRADLPESQRHAERDWKPSIHMPRALSRITLELTDVRVERVQEISSGDVLAEGVSDPDAVVMHAFRVHDPGVLRQGFQFLWDSINAKRGYGWDVNPFVWALTFTRVEVSNG